MTPDPGLVLLARQIAWKHGLNDALVCAVIDRETGGTWNPWLNRYEPRFEQLYGQGVTVGATSFVKAATFTISLSTEIKNRCMSWGLMQIMAETAREYGFTGPAAELCDPATGIEWGCRKFAKCMLAVNADAYSALNRYNGGLDPNYAPDVINRMDKYILPLDNSADVQAAVTNDN
jgi:hypothetical protein